MTIQANFSVNDIHDYIELSLEQTQQAMLNAFQFVGETFVKNARSKVNDDEYVSLLKEYGIKNNSLASYGSGGKSVSLEANSPSFRDITGNLRSSIGFIVLKDGKQVHEFFETSTKGKDKATGKKNGAEFAKELAINYPKGITLIVVAGMDYAAAVESKGRDVITGSSLLVEDQIKKLLTSI